MSAFTEAYVDADGFHVRYLQAGSGPPLVYVHGGGGLRISRAHELLAEHFHVVAFEVPGFGQSAPNERSQTYADIAATLVEAAHRLGLERFNLWGVSFGGMLAVWMAICSPESIEALVLEGPGAIVPEGGVRPPASYAELVQRLFAHPERNPPLPDADLAVVAKQRALTQRLPREPRAEMERRLAGIGVPTLVVFGTLDSMIPPEMGRVYRAKMPHCHFVLLYDAGHEAAADRPEAFSSLVADFLERREAFIVTRKSSLLNP
ncbi:MAG TPA: alpha/beta hydrolase [Chloroflexota bacterium]